MALQMRLRQGDNRASDRRTTGVQTILRLLDAGNVRRQRQAIFYNARHVWHAFLFLDAVGRESEMLPSLDKTHMVPYGGRSSHMTIGQMAELIEFIYTWGLSQGVRFSTDKGVIW
jgi:hypothetical protein